MATIGGLSGSSSANLYGASIKGYGGLASGLDTDSLIQGMTLGTQTKIQTALKKKTTYQWQMTAYRSITDKLIGFSKNYLDISNTNSPYRAGFFSKSLVTASGTNSKHLSVSGASSGIDSMSVLAIKQLAKDTNLITDKNSSIQSMNTGNINFDELTLSKLDGGSISLNYGDKNYTLNFKQGEKIVTGSAGNYTEHTMDFTTAENAKNSINILLDSKDVIGSNGQPTGAKLSSKISFGTDGNDKLTLTHANSADAETLYISGGTEKTLKALGFMKSDGKLVDGGNVETGATLTGEASDVVIKQQFEDFMAGKSLSFNYNGVTKSIKMPDAAANMPTNATDFARYLERELASTFGSGKIEVKVNPNNITSLSFKTVDLSSTIRIANADEYLMGENGVFNMDYGTTNRLNTDASLSKSGLVGLPAGFGVPVSFDTTTGKSKYTPTDFNDADGNLLITINGKRVTGLTVDSSLNSVISAINNSDAGVKLSYTSVADCFSIASTNRGEAGKIDFGELDANGNPLNPGGPTDFLKSLFGVGYNTTIGAADYKKNLGKDAIMTVQYEGQAEMDIKRDTNSFNLDGSTFTLNSTFECTRGPDNRPVAGSEITFSSSVDADKITNVIKEMINDYNKVLEETFNQVGTKPDRDYGPLSDDEKKGLSSEDIKKLEDKAKEGILFNDPLLRSLSDKLRSVFTGVTDVGTLKNMGINVSSDYAANGKLSFDEEAFRNALAENPDQVRDLFTKPAEKDANGNIISSGGFSVRLKSITDSFAKSSGAPKGSLLDKAGSVLSPTTVLQNSLQKLINDIDSDVDVLKDKLQVEIDRYTRQFSALEQLVSQMNAQSGWLTQSLGG